MSRRRRKILLAGGSRDSIQAAAEATFLATAASRTYWSKLDALYLMVGANRLKNRKNPGTYDLTLTGGALYIDQIGIYCDGVDDLIDSNFNPTTAVTPNFVQDTAGFGYWSRSSHPITTGTPMGQFTTSGCTLNGRTSINDNGSYRVNQTAASSLSGAVETDHAAFHGAYRSTSAATSFRRNLVGVSDGVDQASVAPVNVSFKFGTANGSTFAAPAMTFGAGFIGLNLSAAEHDQLYTDLAAFWASYDAVGTAYRPAAYSWWADPIAEVQSGLIVVGGSMGPGQGQIGAQCVMEINEIGGGVSLTKRMQDIYPLDDHHVAASKLLASGKRVSFMTGHGLKEDGVTADHTMSIAVSSNGRVANFGSIRSITNALTAVNYGQIHQMANGRVIVDTNDDGNRLWGIIYSDDDFSSETIAKPHVTQAVAPGGGQNQMYEKSVKIGPNTLRCFNIPHSTNTQNNIRVAQIDTLTGVYSTGGTTFGAGIYQAFGAALTDVTNLAAITALAAGRSARLMDVSSDGTMFLLCEYDNPGGTNASLFLYTLTGANYENPAHWTKSAAIVSMGAPFWASSFYYGGAVFARHAASGILICTATEAAGTWTIATRQSSDGGASWNPTVLKSSAVDELLRPVATGSSVYPWIWQRVAGKTYTQFDNWANMSIEWQ